MLDAERAKHWLGVGAQPTDRVARFLDAAGVKERAARNNPNKGEPGEKAKERAEERPTKAAEPRKPLRPPPPLRRREPEARGRRAPRPRRAAEARRDAAEEAPVEAEPSSPRPRAAVETDADPAGEAVRDRVRAEAADRDRRQPRPARPSEADRG